MGFRECFSGAWLSSFLDHKVSAFLSAHTLPPLSTWSNQWASLVTTALNDGDQMFPLCTDTKIEDTNPTHLKSCLSGSIIPSCLHESCATPCILHSPLSHCLFSCFMEHGSTGKRLLLFSLSSGLFCWSGYVSWRFPKLTHLGGVSLVQKTLWYYYTVMYKPSKMPLAIIWKRNL